jgi:hypothetical protein
VHSVDGEREQPVGPSRAIGLLLGGQGDRVDEFEQVDEGNVGPYGVRLASARQ